MKIRLTVEEAERIAFALCLCQIDMEAQAMNPDGDLNSRLHYAAAAISYEEMCKRFRDAAEKSKGSVTVDIE